MSEYVQAAEVLRGLECAPLTEGDTPVEAVIMVKCLDADGDDKWAIRHTSGLRHVELIGAVEVIRFRTLREMDATWRDDEDDE